eukprot:CAMPEP_0185726130 /NCGR_PEP_ID=MMETSP1171-20130828/2199_1 /TAXON_ID=374046 /ORGANISM="Helicotheca tamensis, Strain CCMP826" /LENGTH=297 /DNA_ID=CAMNT_0028394415 /DNA_START=525 /DNA_END=1418 /DNA_ORIENTATION=+
MSSPHSPQQQSSERIRERFLQKIGIDPPQPNPTETQLDISLPQCTGNEQSSTYQHPSSCLGDVTPFYETLKVCLDDDSSMEDGDDYFDDDDFYIGEDFGFEPMAMERSSTMPVNNSVPEVLTKETAAKPQDASNPGAQTAIVSDEGSSQSESSSSSTDISSMASVRSSCGNLDPTSSKAASKKQSKRRVSLDNDVAVVPIPTRHEYAGHMRERLWSTPQELYMNAARNSIEFAAEGWNWRTVTEDDNMLVCTRTNELIHPIHLVNAMANTETLPENSMDMQTSETQPSGQAIAQPSG